MEPSISVIVRTKNEAATLGRTLQLLAEQTVRPDEVVVVDDSSTDATPDIARAFGCTVVDLGGRPFNHAYSCNLGVRHSRGDLVAITNGHAFPVSDRWLEAGRRHFAQPRVAGVFGLPLPDDRASRWERWAYRLRGDAFGPTGRRVIRQYSALAGLGLLTTTSAMIRRDLWRAHPFDVAVSAVGGGEDSEWAFYYLRHGYAVIEDPAFSVYHCHGDGLVRYLTRCAAYYVTYALAFGRNLRYHQAVGGDGAVAPGIDNDANCMVKEQAVVAETWLIAAAYPKPEDAQAAVADLKQSEFPEKNISVLYTDAGHAIGAGIIDGAVWGGVLGGLFGLLFPPVGLLIAAGPIVGSLTAGATLGAAGALTVGALEGLIAGLVHLGMPQNVATTMGEHVHKGDALVIAHAATASQADTARLILSRHYPRAESAPATGGVVSVAPKDA
jgi:rhamnosyltransferase